MLKNTKSDFYLSPYYSVFFNLVSQVAIRKAW